MTLNPRLVTDKPGYYKKVTYNHHSGTTHFLLSDPAHREKEDARNDIECVSIDDWHRQVLVGKPVHLMKIDVEGMELSVLLSAREVIRVFRPILSVEVNDSALQRYQASCEKLNRVLSDWGYHFFRNRGERNSSNDLFITKRTGKLTREERVYDVLCVHPSNQCYPSDI